MWAVQLITTSYIFLDSETRALDKTFKLVQELYYRIACLVYIYMEFRNSLAVNTCIHMYRSILETDSRRVRVALSLELIKRAGYSYTDQKMC